MAAQRVGPASKVVGVLGGMGPHATLAFVRSMLALTPAVKDWDHLRIVIDDNPHIPSRTRHVLYGEASPVEGMLESCLKLERYPVDMVALPCNSAAVFIPEIQPRLRVPILNICEVAADAVAERHPGARRAVALGGYVTYLRRSYEPFLARHGIELVDHGADVQRRSEQLIEAIKLDPSLDSHVRAMDDMLDALRSDLRADVVVMACTEFGCLPERETAMPVVDSSLELARRTVVLARG